MPLSRKYPWILLLLAGFATLVALTGCNAARDEASSQPAVTTTPAEEGQETSSPDFTRFGEEETDKVANHGAEGSISTTLPGTIEAPFTPGSRPAGAGATVRSVVPPSATPVDATAQIAAPKSDTDIIPPLLVAPVTTPHSPRPFSGSSPATAIPSAMMVPASSVDHAGAPTTATSLAPTPVGMPAAPASVDTASPDAGEETASVKRAPVAEDRGDFAAVTVFYGTDRSSSTTPGQPAQPHRLWLYGAGICVLLFGLFLLMAMASSQRRALAGFAVVSFAAGCVMAIMGTVAWLQSDRAIAGPKLEYGNDRGAFVLGTCEVSIPKSHRVAELEAPSVFRFDFVEDPTRHVVLLDIAEKDFETFFSQLRSRVDQSVAKDAFVFVHGFNVTFEDAARRTAQLAYDLKFQGAPIFYSWPSQGGLFQYAVDETNVVWTVPHLQAFLKEIANQSGARSVHLIAHSMGNRALTSALRELSLELHGAPPLFHEVVLTAPDIDAEIFRRDIAPAIVTTARRVTLYASSNDEALVLSKQVHGYPRAGETGDGLVVIPGIETIDVSAVDTSLVGHSYYGDNATVISDMIDLVRNSKSAKERSWLVTAQLHDLFYWVFRADRESVGAAPASAPSRY